MSGGGIPSAGASLDSAAIAALFRDHHAELVRMALFMVGDLATAEDVVQDVYASLHRGSRARSVEAPLPRRRREVLVLRYYLGLSEAEIAAVLGISAGTVKSTAARALAALARDLGEPS